MWILARPKVKYYGAYPNGFLERAKPLIGGSLVPTLHVCGGHAKEYPAQRLVKGDYTLDLAQDCHPDFCQDALEPLPTNRHNMLWDQILCDPPYTAEDADKYTPGRLELPPPNLLLANALKSVAVGGRVGMLHYVLPSPPKVGVKFIACVGVVVGYNNRMRCFSVFERLV